MYLDNGLAAPCMGGGAWVGAQCWLAGRGVVYLPEPVISLLGGCFIKWIFVYVFFRLDTDT